MYTRGFGDIAPSPWYCNLPTWLPYPWGLTTEERRLCMYSGVETSPPAPPSAPVYVGPSQTPGEVITATKAATDEAQRQAAEEQAARIAAQMAANEPSVPFTANDIGSAGIWIAVAVAGAALLLTR